jgi:hypothetical protein
MELYRMSPYEVQRLSFVNTTMDLQSFVGGGGVLNFFMEDSSLGTFEKLSRATISFVMTVRPSVSTKQLGSQYVDFHDILFLSIYNGYSTR